MGNNEYFLWVDNKKSIENKDAKKVVASPTTKGKKLNKGKYRKRK